MEFKKKIFQGNLKRYRIKLDLTQTQLAEKINSKQANVGAYETGKALPAIDTLIKICEVLDVTPDILLFETIDFSDPVRMAIEIQRLKEELETVKKFNSLLEKNLKDCESKIIKD